jgi:DNA-binding transcriptional regulator GbsR (MarR family)
MDRKLEQFGEILRSIDRDQEQLDRLNAQLKAKPSADLEKRVRDVANRIKDKQKRSDDIEESLFQIRDKVHGAVD